VIDSRNIKNRTDVNNSMLEQKNNLKPSPVPTKRKASAMNNLVTDSSKERLFKNKDTSPKPDQSLSNTTGK